MGVYWYTGKIMTNTRAQSHTHTHMCVYTYYYTNPGSFKNIFNYNTHTSTNLCYYTHGYNLIPQKIRLQTHTSINTVTISYLNKYVYKLMLQHMDCNISNDLKSQFIFVNYYVYSFEYYSTLNFLYFIL